MKLAIAGLVCLLLPMSGVTVIEKIVIYIAAVTVIHILTTQDEEPEEDDFARFLDEITLPGKEHTLRRG